MIILPLIPDPTDIVVQGEQTVFYTPSASMLFPVLQGQVIGDKILISPVPCAMIGLSDLYGVPKKIGPKVVSGGEVVMLDIGSNPVNMLVDPTQTWLYSKVDLDATGAILSLSEDLIGALEPDYYTNRELIGDTDNSLLGLPYTIIPREEITRSGLIKRITSSKPPVSFGKHLTLDSYTESTQRWFITGVTRTGLGVPLGNCRVVVMRTDKILYNFDQYANPVVVETVSDVSGNYSVQVDNNQPYQIFAYLLGSPDLAGITINSIIPVVV